jgi:hypothetical protein
VGPFQLPEGEQHRLLRYREAHVDRNQLPQLLDALRAVAVIPHGKGGPVQTVSLLPLRIVDDDFVV